MSINWSLDVNPVPAVLILPPAAASLDEAHAAIELWEHYSGKVLDPTQRLVVEVIMAENSVGKWAAATTGREMPRQNGKGDEIEVVELWGLVQRAEAILHTVHDAVLLATQAQQRMLSVLERPDLRQRIKRKWQGTGQQMIEMRNGGTIWYRTRTGGGGRGVDDIDRLVVDEAQHATEEHLAAVAPTLLANSNPQMNALGTAGIDGKSDWWWSVRRRTLLDSPGAFGYVGHTAERFHLNDRGELVQEPVDVQDRSRWKGSNPAVSSGRGQGMEFLEEQLLRLGEASFAREHLCVWDPPSDSPGASLFDMDAWAALDDGLERDRPSPVAFGVSMSPDRKWSYIGVAGVRSDGHRQVQVARSGRGATWVVDALVEMSSIWHPVGVAINPASPAGALIPSLELTKVKLVKVSGREVGQAVGMFLDEFAAKNLRHSSQRLLDMSLEFAALRDSGGSKVWVPRSDETDISPLDAVTLPLFVLAKKKPARTTGGRRAVLL